MKQGALIAVGIVAALALAGGGGGGSPGSDIVRGGHATAYIQWLYDNVPVIDRQDEAATVRYKPGDWSGAEKIKRTYNSPRPLSDVFGICLHQVGVDNVGDSAWPKITCHVGVTEDGKVYRIHPYDTWLAASHGFNSGTIAIEVGGLWRGEEELPPHMVHALRRAILLILDDMADMGYDVGIIVTHRQVAASRGNDSGRTIWQQGALWARDVLGCELDPDYSHGSGRPVPGPWMEVPPPTPFAAGPVAGQLGKHQQLQSQVVEMNYAAPGDGAVPPVAARRLRARMQRPSRRDFV